jgi:hypothetical protein
MSALPPNSNRESRHAAKRHVGFTPERDMCSAASDVCFGPIADMVTLIQSTRRREAIQVKVRMPKDLHRQISRAANQYGQTVNAEILFRLFDSFVLGEKINEVGDMVSILMAMHVLEWSGEKLPADLDSAFMNRLRKRVTQEIIGEYERVRDRLSDNDDRQKLNFMSRMRLRVANELDNSSRAKRTRS